LRVIPVLDLRAGRAVLARGGRRDAYAPVGSRLVAGGVEGRGDPLALARAYRDILDCDEWYVADLDALAGGAVQRVLLRALAGLRGRLLVDAAVTTPERARELVADGVARVVVGLETLPSLDALALVTRAIGSKRVVFSLDLRDGAPLAESSLSGMPLEVARAAVAAGAGALIVLDLARVGSRRGVDVALVATLRRALPYVELLAGGGIGTTRDLERLADAGLDGALVATALHDGTIKRDDVAAVRRADHPSDSR
jgi:HisA/HisF family protein